MDGESCEGIMRSGSRVVDFLVVVWAFLKLREIPNSRLSGGWGVQETLKTGSHVDMTLGHIPLA